ncbi:deoxyhypusine synthase family protein [Desulfonatronovibrio hydrogenovorans]|uniref:deoxyhypusine synthase family protein n=1 Tax=Desulfonatronovibrio hydrogenovorans TaxID=53245 RepID=UPI000490D129|nr:deoxyhypusine synthase family protein [Desulfonatronovibrio hydrogenovorans]
MKKKKAIRTIESLHNPGEMGLKPLVSLDPDQIDDFDDLLQAMSKTSFSGRSLGESLDVLEEMVTDPDCCVVGTFSGAMTVAKMGTLICKMIEEGWLNVVISTGALMAHGFIESIGLKHYKYEKELMDDKELFKHGFNRVYDTLEPEINFIRAEDIIHKVMQGIDPNEILCSEKICRKIGQYLNANIEGRGILKSAYQHGVPVYIPAFTDSELALDIATHILRIKTDALEGEDFSSIPYPFNPFHDLLSYTRKIAKSKKIGIFTIGGGVPRNWGQQVGPFLEIANQRLKEVDLPLRRFQYGVRICPEPVHWGGLSGCTYQEGISWGKFVPRSEGGRYAEIYSDATIAWPILIKGLQQRLAKKK